MKIALLIGIGGFIGSVGRYMLNRWVHDQLDNFFPFGTMVVNILGSLLIGIIFGLSLKGSIMSNELKMFLVVGFCGGFTTFSSFTNDGLSLLRDGQVTSFFLYIGISVIFGLLAVYAGYVLSKIIG